MCMCFWNCFSNYSTSTEEDSCYSSHTVLLISPFVINDLPSPDGWSGLRAQYEIREQSKANWPSRELNL